MAKLGNDNSQLAKEASKQQNQHSQLLAEITLKIRQSLHLEEILQTAVTEVRNLLQADRVVIYRLWSDEAASVVTEAVVSEWPAILGKNITDDCFQHYGYMEQYRQGRTRAITDIEKADIQPCHVEFLKQFDVKANLVVPILHQEELWGLLIAHQCAYTRQWSSFETELLKQLADQMGIALAQAQLLKALRQSEERYALAIRGANDGLWDWNLKTNEVYFSPRWKAMLGCQEHEIGNSINEWLNRVHSDEQEQVRAQIAAHLEGITSHFESEYRMLHQDGTYSWIFTRGLAIRDAKGNACRIAGSQTDISERKAAEVTLRSSVATNRALLRAIPDLIFRISKNGTFVNFKAAKENNLPMPASELLGKHLYEVLPTEVAQPTINCVERALSTGEVQIFESQVLVNNNLRDYEFRIAVSTEDEVMVIVRDITERKRAEEDIRKALEKEKELSELKSRFVSMVSHEFRTPLTTILSSTELLEYYGHKSTEKEKLDLFKQIRTAIQRTTQLLEDILSINTAEAGNLEFKPASLELEKFCCDLIKELQFNAGTKHVISLVSQGQCTNACMDEKLLRHIFTNLLSNAVKYSPQGGTIHFEVTCQQEEAIFQVKDEGIGIPLEEQQRLFEPFHRAKNVGTIPGTGLGLSIVKRLVDLQQGNIVVTSKVGVGTTFTVSLPLNRGTNKCPIF
jgi:PAS domain S-box-containing protein